MEVEVFKPAPREHGSFITVRNDLWYVFIDPDGDGFGYWREMTLDEKLLASSQS